MPAVWAKIIENTKLLSLPEIYLRLRSVLDDPDFSMGDVAQVISHDPAMSAKLLRLVNSAYFGFAAKIDTVSRAVGMLGTKQVHDLVLAASVAQTFEGIDNQVMDMQRFWSKSVYCAIVCRELAVKCDVLDSERPFVAGLLRDIGHLIMFQAVPEQIELAIQHSRRQGVSLFKVERVLLGVDYAKVGGALMRQWNLPRSLWEPTEFHVEPAVADEFQMVTALVHIAAAITDAVQDEQDVSLTISKLIPDVWQATGLTPEQCVDAPERAEQQLSGVMHLIFPTPGQAVG